MVRKDICLNGIKKFPEPKLFLDKIKHYGIHLTANLKPAILTSHPFYKKAAKEKIFISDNNNKPLVIQFWDETASLIDFTKKTELLVEKICYKIHIIKWF